MHASRMMHGSRLRVFKIRQTRTGKDLTMTTDEAKSLAVATELAGNDPGRNHPAPNHPARAFSRRAIAIVAILAACAALAIASGLHSRLSAQTRLHERAQA